MSSGIWDIRDKAEVIMPADDRSKSMEELLRALSSAEQQRLARAMQTGKILERIITHGVAKGLTGA